jgi:hypothetical protein
MPDLNTDEGRGIVYRLVAGGISGHELRRLWYAQPKALGWAIQRYSQQHIELCDCSAHERHAHLHRNYGGAKFVCLRCHPMPGTPDFDKAYTRVQEVMRRDAEIRKRRSEIERAFIPRTVDDDQSRA